MGALVGALVGVLVGGLVGVLVGALVGGSLGGSAGGSALVGVVVGALVGALVRGPQLILRKIIEAPRLTKSEPIRSLTKNQYAVHLSCTPACTCGTSLRAVTPLLAVKLIESVESVKPGTWIELAHFSPFAGEPVRSSSAQRKRVATTAVPSPIHRQKLFKMQ